MMVIMGRQKNLRECGLVGQSSASLTGPRGATFSQTNTNTNTKTNTNENTNANANTNANTNKDKTRGQ